ncbi:H6S1B-like protein [Mya arenaria]|uniref:Heparan-sulfate 6-O-sulfotransferase n=1 Tax=Mya arenaria TaxID=6604 RepID=A0ABY7DAP8_MYAAR|nr:heparan-sulfate 6-O-sulfotransferase 1-B-like [Mya arenaria]WAQ94741.1 H6S1B-like protein [Mya arenaria]
MPIKHDTRSGKTYTIDELRELMRSNPTFKENVLNQKYYHPKTKDVLKRYFLGEAYSFNIKFDDLGSRSYDIKEDVIVNIHMQKTGGTHLEDRFKKDLQLPFKCQSKGRACKCLNGQGNMWLFTPVFTGYACGLHPDWTQLHRCIEDSFNKQEGKTRSRRYFYITQLRDPLERYLSEYHHQTTSGHWEESIIGCGVRDKPYWNDMRPCFVTKDWRGVSFSDFMACPFNLATNRMTRMLADLVPTQCYSKYLDERQKKIRAEKWVDSAKQNIRNMEYFRLMERPEESDFLFAKVFDLHFKNKDRMIASGTTKLRMTENEFMKMIQLAELDIHIYLFAQDIFNHRLI